MHIEQIVFVYVLMPFLMKNDKTIKKYNEILERIINSIKKDFNSEPVQNDCILKPAPRSKSKIL